jgi:hypothetical protein
MTITRFPGLDEYSRVALRRLATNWRDSPTRPSVSGHDALAWHRLVQDWVEDPCLPLLVRRPGAGRGREIVHPSGRVLVPVDYSPALYLLSLAIEGRRPTLDQLLGALRDGRMPVAACLANEERDQARYSGTLESMDAPNLINLGFALCHVTHIGLRRLPLEKRALQELTAHSLLFLSPVNMYVVPREYAGLGELPEFVDEMDDARSFTPYPPSLM